MGVASLRPFGSAPPFSGPVRSLPLLPSPAIPSSPVRPVQPGRWRRRRAVRLPLPPARPPPSSSIPLTNCLPACACPEQVLQPCPWCSPTLFHHIAISVHGKTNSALLVSTSPGSYLSLTWPACLPISQLLLASRTRCTLCR